MNNLTAQDIHNLTKERYDKMTFEEKQEEKMKFTRDIRNRELEKTDAYMNQIDRFSQKQIDQLKAYRQELRDIIQKSDWNDLDKQLEFPQKPAFL